MTGEEIRELTAEEILKVNNRAVLIELPTGYGKSKIGMDLCLRDNPNTILIVIPRLILIDNWKYEFIKWGQEDVLNKVVFSTYAGIHNMSNKCYDCIIFDEAHHITPRVQGYLETINASHYIMLSATVQRTKKEELKSIYPDLYCYKVSTKEAIDNEVLPDPTVYLYPLMLDTVNKTETITKHSSGKITVVCDYKDRWKYLRDKNIQLTIRCTQFQKNLDINNEIDFWKKRYMRTRNIALKNKWLHLAGTRLEWLSSLKNDEIKRLLELFQNERVLTFCNSIEQTEILGKHCINSKNKESANILESFNEGKIKHITACNMLNEGMNLSNCRIGIYANLNSSETIIKQRLGRILRHKNPIIVIPFYKNTREEELVNKMLEDYNPQLVKIITNIKEVTL